jgi:GntR family transcriptional repressor for pyruvate dehydrogenase complex
MASGTWGKAVSQGLISDIQTGVFVQGTKLPPERALMARYSVGRNTLREAVHGLVALGMLEVRAGVGTTVRMVDGAHALDRSVAGALFHEAAVDDLLEFRLLLETDAAARAAERAEAPDHAAIREALADYQDAVRLGTAIYEKDVAFHRAIANATHNAIYVKVIDTTAQLLIGAMREADRAPGDIAAAAQEHALVAHHILLGDSAAAEHAMRTHILAGNERRYRGKASAD